MKAVILAGGFGFPSERSNNVDSETYGRNRRKAHSLAHYEDL